MLLLDAAVAVDALVEGRIIPPCIRGWMDDMNVMASMPARACLIPSITIILSLLSPSTPTSPADPWHEPALLISLIISSTSFLLSI